MALHQRGANRLDGAMNLSDVRGYGSTRRDSGAPSHGRYHAAAIVTVFLGAAVPHPRTKLRLRSNNLLWHIFETRTTGSVADVDTILGPLQVHLVRVSDTKSEAGATGFQKGQCIITPEVIIVMVSYHLATLTRRVKPGVNSPYGSVPRFSQVLVSFFAKGLFRSSIPTSVAVECIWTTCFVIFNLILSLYSLGVGADIRATGARVPLPFLFVEVCCWGLTGLMITYSSLVVCSSVLTAITFDRDVWFRDITGSPSPFPVVLCVYSVKLWLAEVRHPSSTSRTQHTPHCLPGCTCKEKVPPPSPPTALPPLGLQSAPRGSNLANAQSAVPGVRVPTALERHNSIFVGLEV
ncbi:hypothetical protein H4582DRAFT_2057983 [Lactarius indigo]|nr:hypothetical protein H4582DRAFT_2057983 [Lactarius indigo]